MPAAGCGQDCSGGHGRLRSSQRRQRKFGPDRPPESSTWKAREPGPKRPPRTPGLALRRESGQSVPAHGNETAPIPRRRIQRVEPSPASRPVECPQSESLDQPQPDYGRCHSVGSAHFEDRKPSVPGPVAFGLLTRGSHRQEKAAGNGGPFFRPRSVMRSCAFATTSARVMGLSLANAAIPTPVPVQPMQPIPITDRSQRISFFDPNAELLLHRQNPVDLLHVIDVVASKHPYDRFDALLAAFGMHPMLLPLLGG